ncbi:ankyrin repeat domain-containing protein, partial [Escherichia coli]|uniref:ankyrin repeat domain-containing protein n=1 Tax=Escherichia coli TaxID=562 RepID=UPI00217D2EB6
DRNRSHWSTSKTPSYTKSVSWQHHLVKELLAHTEINVNQTNHVGWTPLLEAIVLNDGGIKQQAIVQLLLEHGASPHLTDKYGKTPLELARERGFEEIAQLLIAAGA